MAYTTTDLENVDAAIAGGELSVSIGDRRVTYRSLDELERIRNLIIGDLDQQAGRRRRRMVRVTVSKGL